MQGSESIWSETAAWVEAIDAIAAVIGSTQIHDSIQSLNDAPAMVEFSHFPGSLANAAEIYANLEIAVRAAEEAERAVIFDASNEQMARLDSSTQRQLTP